MQKSSVKQPLPQYYTPDEVAESLGVTRRTIYEWLLGGVLKAGKAGRKWVITPAQVEEFISVRNGSVVPQVVPVVPSESLSRETSPQAVPQGKTAAQIQAEFMAEMDASELADEFFPVMRPMAAKPSQKKRRR